MKNKTGALLLILLMHFCGHVNAQKNINYVKKYLVLTFEVKKKGSKVEYCYWITPVDSINERKPFEVFPLYTDDYSKDLLERCIAGKPIDLFSYSTATNFNFDDNYNLRIKNLLAMISVNKVKIQSFSKKWGTNTHEQEDINVYATPITGEFCRCLQIYGKATYGFKGLAYLPVASFSYDKDFWENKEKEIVKYLDYSYVAYSSHYPTSIHGNNNIRVKGSIELF